MANHKSAIKRHRQSLKRRDRNRIARLALRETIKKARVAAQSGDKSSALKLAQEAERSLAKAAGKSIVHKRNAARRISRLMKSVTKVSADKPKSTKAAGKSK